MSRNQNGQTILSVRVPNDLVDRLDACADHVHRTDHPAKPKVTQTDLFRAALARGLRQLEEEQNGR